MRTILYTFITIPAERLGHINRKIQGLHSRAWHGMAFGAFTGGFLRPEIVSALYDIYITFLSEFFKRLWVLFHVNMRFSPPRRII
jgi:hypothetical protein